MDPLLRLKFVSECFMFCLSGRSIFYILFYDLLERFDYEFRLSQHSTGNWKSAISIEMSDGGHKKGIGEGVGIDNLQELTQGHILSLK